jgi:hypothetical protein
LMCRVGEPMCNSAGADDGPTKLIFHFESVAIYLPWRYRVYKLICTRRKSVRI